MASNKSTPKSVLKAPKLKLKWLHKTKGLNRDQRRHGYLYQDEDTGAVKYQRINGFMPKVLQHPALNKPYKKRKPRTKKGD